MARAWSPVPFFFHLVFLTIDKHIKLVYNIKESDRKPAVRISANENTGGIIL